MEINPKLFGSIIICGPHRLERASEKPLTIYLKGPITPRAKTCFTFNKNNNDVVCSFLSILKALVNSIETNRQHGKKKGVYRLSECDWRIRKQSNGHYTRYVTLTRLYTLINPMGSRPRATDDYDVRETLLFFTYTRASGR